MYTQLVEILLLDMGIKTDMMPMSAHEPKGEKTYFYCLWNTHRKKAQTLILPCITGRQERK